MTKKIVAIVAAMMMVLALSVSAFAVDVLTDDVKGVAQNANVTLAIPEDLGLDNGVVVTMHVKGTADNTMVRFYLTDASDNGRVTEVFEVPVENGAFDATADFTVDTTGTIQGTAAPTIVMIKGPDYATPPENLVLEVVELSVAGADEPAAEEETAEAPADEPAAEESAAEAPAEDAPAAEAPAETTTEAPAETTPAPAPAETTKAPSTGIALAVVPAVVALAAVAISKKH